jgi:hypothetical protein
VSQERPFIAPGGSRSNVWSSRKDRTFLTDAGFLA